jgi:two-component system sensor histidine kinase RpfC
MSFNRLVFAGLIVLILLPGTGSASSHLALAWMVVYFVLAFGGLAHIIWRPGICQARRVYALLLDCGFLSWQLHLGGERVALFYPVYLWVIFGNSFRFGIKFLLLAVPVATLSFLLVVLSTPFWFSQPHLSAGLLIGLVILPAYAGTLIKKLSLATLAAEKANKAKSLFLASVSHELRTPLTAIIGMNQMLRTTALGSAQREMVETVDVASRSLQTLINQLLDFSRIEAGQMTSTIEEFDLLTLLIDVRRIVESQVREKNLAFTIHVTPRTPLRVKTSRLQLQEILVNLVGNAVKFTEAGSVEIALDGQLMEGSEGELTLRGEIADTGIGIPVEAQARIFESFTQGDASILNKFGGTGLGLAITRRLVGILGGDITVESKVGEGSLFRFHIKALRATEEAWQPPAGKVGLRVRNPLKRSLLRTTLTAMGVKVELMKPANAASAEESGVSMVVEYYADGEMVDMPSGGLPRTILIQPSAAPGLPERAIRQRCVTLLSDDFSDQELQQALLIASRFSVSEMSASREGEILTAPVLPPLPVSLISRDVLLVDDNRINQRVFTRILEAAGHKVTVADDGNRAIDMLEREGERFDIVLMDFNMPGMDGLEVTKLYRLMSLGQTRLPIIGLTADAFAQANGDWRNADMDDCLVKPVAPQDLVAVVEKMARVRQGQSSAAPVEARAKQNIPALDEAIIANLRQLGDSQFLHELLSDFLADAENLIDQLVADAARGDSPEFRNHAHALRSSAANVGAKGLGELCTNWHGLRGTELRAQAASFAARADVELKMTRQAVMALGTIRRVNNQ